MDGRFLHLIPKSVQARGKAGSHVTLKCLHRRQSGARSGIVVSGAGSSFIVFDSLTLYEVSCNRRSSMMSLHVLEGLKPTE